MSSPLNYSRVVSEQLTGFKVDVPTKVPFSPYITRYDIKSGSRSSGPPPYHVPLPYSRTRDIPFTIRTVGTFRKPDGNNPLCNFRPALWHTQFSEVISTQMSVSTVWGADLQAERGLLLNTALSRLNNAKFAGSTFLGEFRQTKKMVLKRGLQLAKLLHKRDRTRMIQDFRRRRAIILRRLASMKNPSPQAVKVQNQLLKDIADAWLEVSFGWKPLISDISSMVEQFSLLTDEKTASGYVHAKAKIQRTKPIVVNIPSEEIAHGVRRSLFYSFYVDAEMRVYLGGKLPDASRANVTNRSGAIAKRLGISWSDAILAAWELVPYSFVVDYFVNIGEMLNFNVAPVPVQWGCESSKLRATGFTVDSNIVSGGCYAIEGFQTFSSGATESFAFTRSVLDSNAYGGYFRIANGLDQNRLANLAALVTQAALRKLV